MLEAMATETQTGNEQRTPESYRQQIAHALDHAADLISAADRVLGEDNRHANIAYHLGILALEEIGRAGILAQAMVAGRIGASRMEQRLDDHVFKLMHAVWAPTIGGGKIDPKDFEEARAFAASTHERRLAGLYTDHDPPRDAVSLDHATSIINLAKVSLELSRTRGVPSGETTEELEWYLDTVSSEVGRKRLFSKSFIDKHEELKGDTRAWVRWAKGEFEQIAAAEQAYLQRELSRQVDDASRGTPKWKMKVRLYSASHSIRPSELNYWNERIEPVKLLSVGNRKQELLMEITIHDRITVGNVFDAGLSLSKLYLVALSVGSAGFFWYELTTQAQKYYESLRDLDASNHELHMHRNRGLPKEWSDPEGKKKYVLLEKSHLENAVKFLAAFGPLPDEVAAPIFGPYLQGMVLLAKTDIHLSLEKQAQQAFMEALRRALQHFGDWDGTDESFVDALHSVL
jgi:AbiV family abortive infection protein